MRSRGPRHQGSLGQTHGCRQLDLNGDQWAGAFSQFLEKIPDESGVQDLDALVVQRTQLVQQVFRWDVSKTVRADSVEIISRGESIVGSFSEELVKVTAKV